MSHQSADARIDDWIGFVQTLRLVSLDPSRNRARVYIFSWQPTLWGEIALIRTWGRLERPTRSLLRLYPDRASAEPELRRLLRRRLQHGYEVVVCC
jgi:predicted DNA-binding WGR domain protein